MEVTDVAARAGRPAATLHEVVFDILVARTFQGGVLQHHGCHAGESDRESAL